MWTPPLPLLKNIVINIDTNTNRLNELRATDANKRYLERKANWVKFMVKRWD